MKKIISIILAGAMITGLCACGKGGRTTFPSRRTEEETTEVTSEETTEEETAAASEETSSETSEDTSETDLTAASSEESTDDPEPSVEVSEERPGSAHPVNVSFEGLSTSEIIDSVRNILLVDSDPIDLSYGDRFSIYAENMNYIYEWDLDALNISSGVRHVEIFRQPGEDETIELRNNTNVSVRLYFDNDGDAGVVYNDLVRILAREGTDNQRNPTTDNREGFRWYTIFGAHYVEMFIHENPNEGCSSCEINFVAPLQPTFS